MSFRVPLALSRRIPAGQLLSFAIPVNFSASLWMILRALLLLNAGVLQCESSAILLGDLPLLVADQSGAASSSGMVRTVHPGRTRLRPMIAGSVP